MNKNFSVSSLEKVGRSLHELVNQGYLARDFSTNIYAFAYDGNYVRAIKNLSKYHIVYGYDKETNEVSYCVFNIRLSNALAEMEIIPIKTKK